jgi:Domain of unknown function (DUF2024)
MSQSHVFDTYAKTAQGRIMHFDVVLDEKDAAKALGYANVARKYWRTRCGSDTRKLCVLPQRRNSARFKKANRHPRIWDL